MSMTHEQAKTIAEQMKDQITLAIEEEDELEEEQYGIAGADDEPDDLASEPLSTGINLATIPVSQWGELQVSRISQFRDIRWDWRQEGSPIYQDATFFDWNQKLAPELPLILEEHHPLITLLRALLFYCLPQNAVFLNVRSYNTVVGWAKGLLSLARFLVSMGCYVDRHGDGNYKTASQLSAKDFKIYFDTLTTANDRLRFHGNVRHWHQLSQAGLLPAELQLPFQVFDEDDAATIYAEFESSKEPWQPIDLETLQILVPHCINVIENYADDILAAYALIGPAIWRKAKDFDWHDALLKMEEIKTDAWNMEDLVDTEQTMSMEVGQALKRAILRHPGWPAISEKYGPNIWKLQVAETKAAARELGIDLRSFSRAIHYDLAKVRHLIQNQATELRNACAVIILFVTGMRRSELANLEAGSYWQIGQSGEYRLSFRVFKTSDASSGDRAEIPIPLIAWQALNKMEGLSKAARLTGGTNLLFASATNNFGKPISLNAINTFIERFCADLGLEAIHPHQFRKTLAMFLIYQDSANLPLIKRLFSHKSLKMTLAYITKLPGLSEEIKLAIIEQNADLMTELLQGAKDGKLGGKAGKRIQETLRNEKYAAMLSEDGWETLRQYVDSLLDEGVALLHRAALGVICTKTLSMDEAAPCDPPYAPNVARLHPNVQNCDPLECKWAVFTEASVARLQQEIVFHNGVLSHPYTGDKQRRFSEQHVRQCEARLSELGVDIITSPLPSAILQTGVTEGR